MAEKRKLPPRAGREPAAKRRVSEAATPQSSTSTSTSKKKAATPRAPTPPPPEPVDAPLPNKLRDGEGLPITRERQPSSLSDKDYQSIAESAVLLASLERSKKKWLSDGILVRYYTKPKKTKREQIVQNNPPKESMSKLGACDVTIGPHLFDAMIYTVKDPNAQTSIQYAPPRQMVHYNHPNNFQQQRYQYPSPSNQGRPPYSPAPARPQGYPDHQYYQRGPQHAPPPSGQRPPQPQNAQQPAKPSPDPVIQMLATRAAADPELKALMRVVASSQASQEQLRAFQAHIDELNAIIKAREQQEQRQQNAAAAAAPEQAPHPAPAGQTQSIPPQEEPESAQKKDAGSKPTPQETDVPAQPASQSETHSKESQQQSTSTSTAAPGESAEATPRSGAQTPAQPENDLPAAEQAKSSVKSKPAPAPSGTPSAPAASTPSATPGSISTPAPPAGSHGSPSVRPGQTPGNFQPPPPRPGPPLTPSHQSPYGNQPPLQSRPPQYGSPASYHRQPAPLPPQMRNFKAIVFEFTSPLTPYGSSSSGHAGSGDRYLFPEYSILEWLPAENTMLASFLVVKKVDPAQPFPIEPASDNGPNRAKGKGTSKSKKTDTKGKSSDSTAPATPTQVPGTPSTDTPQNPDIKPNGIPETPGTPSEPPTNEANLKEYWQPVTWRIHSTTPRLFEPLTRVVKPADEVRKYMNEIMDRAERAPDGFPALRLPREEAREAFESEGTPASANAAATAARSRISRAKSGGEDSGVENANDLEEEDELLDFYGEPSGLPPLTV